MAGWPQGNDMIMLLCSGVKSEGKFEPGPGCLARLHRHARPVEAKAGCLALCGTPKKKKKEEKKPKTLNELKIWLLLDVWRLMRSHILCSV